MECAAVSSKRRLAANDLSAAEVSRADQRETKAAAADERRRAGTVLPGRFVAESASQFDAEDDELAAMGLDKLWVGSFLGTPGICQRSPRESALSATGLTGRSEGRDEGGICVA